VIIREICSQFVGQERCEHVVYAVSQKRLLGAMYHVSAFRPRVCNRVMFACVFGHGCNSHFGFVVEPTQSYLPERGADSEQVLVSTVSR
jgi:hypothetical protein